MFLFIISTNKEYAEWPAPRQNNKKRENAAGHVTDLQPSFNNTPTQAIMHVYQIMKTIIIYTKNIEKSSELTHYVDCGRLHASCRGCHHHDRHRDCFPTSYHRRRDCT